MWQRLYFRHRIYLMDEAFPSKMFPSHAGIVADIDGKRITAISSITPELMILQKKMTMLCSEIVKFFKKYLEKGVK